jgi:hypothetical protein
MLFAPWNVSGWCPAAAAADAVAAVAVAAVAADPSDSPLYSTIRARVRKEVFDGAENRGWHRRGSEVRRPTCVQSMGLSVGRWFICGHIQVVAVAPLLCIFSCRCLCADAALCLRGGDRWEGGGVRNMWTCPPQPQ